MAKKFHVLEVFPTEDMISKDLTRGFIEDDRYGFEEVTYLLLFGSLPDKKQLADFTQLLANQRSLPTNFVRDVIMKAPSKDIMNGLSRSVLTLYSYDTNPDDTSLPNVLRQCLNLISVFPLLSVYGLSGLLTIILKIRVSISIIRRKNLPQQRTF